MFYRYVLLLAAMLAAKSIGAEPLTFAAALTIAEQHAPALSAAKSRLKSTTAAAIPAGALPDPRLQVGIDNLPISGADRGSLTQDFMTMEKVGVMQDIPNADKRHARENIAQAETEQSQTELNLQRLAVRRNTARAWLKRYYLEQKLALFDALEKENQLFSQTVTARVGAGQGMASDTVMPREEAIELADRRDRVLRDIAAATADLARWVTDDAYANLAGPAPDFSIDPAHLRLHIHHHPELAVYEPRIAVATAEIQEAIADKKPDWGVGVVYARRGAAYSDMVSLEFTVGLPLFTGTRQGPRIDAKRNALDALEAEQQTMLFDHRAELEADLAEYSAIDRQLTRLRTQRLLLAQEKLDLHLAAYRSGKTDLDNVIAARSALLESRLQLLDMTGQRAALAAKLHFTFEETAP